jgi:excinuclease ABC subunit C
MTYPAELLEKLTLLPDRPGVYLYRDGAGEFLYVGKALSLRSRVRSYFQASAKHPPRIRRLIDSVQDFEWIVVDTEREALLLESNLIKKHRPAFNVVLRDDKHFPYLKLSVKDKYPRLSVVRRATLDGNLYVGPFTPPSIARRTMKMVPRFFQVATCRETFDGKRRPCLYYHLDQCLAPCAGKTTPEEYGAAVDKVRLLLQGKYTDLESVLHDAMGEASKTLEYERAARHRDALRTTRDLAARQNVSSVGGENQDYWAHHREGECRALQVFQLREGKLQGRREFSFDSVTEKDSAFYAGVLAQYYAEGEPPEEIYLSALPDDAELLTHWLSERARRRVRLAVPQRGRKKSFLTMVERNAEQAFEIRFRSPHRFGVEAAESLAEALDLEHAPTRIECFDISHVQGTDTVASLVVFEEGQPRKAEYRQFNIKTVEGVDDYASMAEAVTRRYRRILKEGRRLPDLVLIDGGAGQLGAAVRATTSVGLAMLPVAALAKREEALYLEGQGEPLLLSRHSPALHLVQRIRDEAHRFAVSRHRRRRSRRTLKTSLTEIPGIGPRRARELLRSFGSVDGVRSASREELEKVVGNSLSRSIEVWREGVSSDH